MNEQKEFFEEVRISPLDAEVRMLSDKNDEPESKWDELTVPTAPTNEKKSQELWSELIKISSVVLIAVSILFEMYAVTFSTGILYVIFVIGFKIFQGHAVAKASASVHVKSRLSKLRQSRYENDDEEI